MTSLMLALEEMTLLEQSTKQVLSRSSQRARISRSTRWSMRSSVRLLEEAIFILLPAHLGCVDHKF